MRVVLLASSSARGGWRMVCIAQGSSSILRGRLQPCRLLPFGVVGGHGGVLRWSGQNSHGLARGSLCMRTGLGRPRSSLFQGPLPRRDLPHRAARDLPEADLGLFERHGGALRSLPVHGETPPSRGEEALRDGQRQLKHLRHLGVPARRAEGAHRLPPGGRRDHPAVALEADVSHPLPDGPQRDQVGPLQVVRVIAGPTFWRHVRCPAAAARLRARSEASRRFVLGAPAGVL
mmetsp:Transcript_98115/g.282030  ORF Transcript_98115/g.282030 Transcript_98115/m.282030 type:complete len:232 (-) Transcript_98115:748-1443(-)